MLMICTVFKHAVWESNFFDDLRNLSLILKWTLKTNKKLVFSNSSFVVMQLPIFHKLASFLTWKFIVYKK